MKDHVDFDLIGAGGIASSQHAAMGCLAKLPDLPYRELLTGMT